LVVLAGFGAARGLLGGLDLQLGPERLGCLELGGDERVVLRAQVDLVVEILARRLAALGLGGREIVVELEGLDLLDRRFELVGDPGVGAALADQPRIWLRWGRNERRAMGADLTEAARRSRACGDPQATGRALAQDPVCDRAGNVIE